MRIRRSLSLAAALAAIPALGCHNAAAPSPPAGVRVEAAVPAAVAEGERVPVAVAVRNEGARDRFVTGSAGGCIAVTEVRDARGGRVEAYDPRLCDSALARHRLAAGGALADGLRLPGLPRGAYRVRAAVGVDGHGPVWSEFVALEVRAP